ncbi:MAG TPA: DUF4349 domain-containing protein [Gaiellaceae bacterium]|nr:DUF4349 domain-containing protein [Gaiellaceae bacterium]
MSTSELTTILRAGAPAAPERLRERVLAARPEPRRRRPRVRPVLVLAAAAALAVGAALVHGFATSAPHHVLNLSDHASSGASVGGGGGVTTATFAQAPAARAPKDAPSTQVAPAPNRLQHEDASIGLRVGDVGEATGRATRVAASLGGYAQSVVYRDGQANLELRVPTDRVKQAVARLEQLGTIVSQRIAIEDLTSTLETQSAQIAQLRRRVAALQTALRSSTLTEAQRVLLQIKLAEAKRALSQRLHARKGTLAAGETARISLVLTTQKQAAAAPHRRGRVGRMLHDAVGFLALEGIVLLFALIVASPLAVAFALWWIHRRRATERLLME